MWTTPDADEGDRFAFTTDERPLVEAAPGLAAFSTIRAAHVIGLLEALGEYALRAPSRASHGVDEFPGVWVSADAMERHDALSRFWRTRCKGFHRLDEPDISPLDVSIPLPEPRRAVFQPATRERLSRFQYITGLEEITVSELCTLLGRLAAYSVVAHAMSPLDGKWIEGLSRLIHAHNRLVSFPTTPFTCSEFWESEVQARRESAKQAASARPSQSH